MKYTIKEYNESKNEFKAICEDNSIMYVDPYVTCAFEGEPEEIIGKTFETINLNYFRPLLLPGEGDFNEIASYTNKEK